MMMTTMMMMMMMMTMITFLSLVGLEPLAQPVGAPTPRRGSPVSLYIPTALAIDREHALYLSLMIVEIQKTTFEAHLMISYPYH